VRGVLPVLLEQTPSRAHVLVYDPQSFAVTATMKLALT